MSNDRLKQEVKYHFAGWVVFVICAVLFIASSLKSGDILMLVASIVFLAACIIFIIPLIKTITDERGNKK
ncbi:MAG: hypothetical protein U9R17_05515 [Thermodesulfobacteriota bacterium]|nr:hypothetical protein [Thermodesulfobacteriota bacterium]